MKLPIPSYCLLYLNNSKPFPLMNRLSKKSKEKSFKKYKIGTSIIEIEEIIIFEIVRVLGKEWTDQGQEIINTDIKIKVEEIKTLIREI